MTYSDEVGDAWFEAYLRDDQERDYAEEAYWRNRCPACESQHGRDEECDRELPEFGYFGQRAPELIYTVVPEPTDPKPMSRDEECADVPYAYSGSFTFGVHIPEEMTAPPVEPIEPTKPMSRRELVASGVVIGVIFLIVLACMAAGILPATT